MSESRAVRKATLTLHVASSVGWLGAVLVYLALGVAAVTSDDTGVVAAVYIAMDWAAWVVLVPLAVASLATGVLEALTSRWGLLQHYWVVVKLVLTLGATVVLVTYTQTLSSFAAVAESAPLNASNLALLRSPSVVLHATGAAVLLALALVLAVYKPRGLTRHGQRQRLSTGGAASRT